MTSGPTGPPDYAEGPVRWALWQGPRGDRSDGRRAAGSAVWHQTAPPQAGYLRFGAKPQTPEPPKSGGEEPDRGTGGEPQAEQRHRESEDQGGGEHVGGADGGAEERHRKGGEDHVAEARHRRDPAEVGGVDRPDERRAQPDRRSARGEAQRRHREHQSRSPLDADRRDRQALEDQ